jgi:hypothetical protein
MNNKKIGDSTETKVANMFHNKHYWAHVFAKSTVGAQPVDIIAAKGGEQPQIWLVDAKHVRNQDVSFTFERIEANQRTSMMVAKDWAKIDAKKLGFAIEFDRTGGIYWMSYENLLEYELEGKKSIHYSQLRFMDEVIDDAH